MTSPQRHCIWRTVANENNTVMPVRDFGFDGESFEQYTRELCTDELPGRIIMIEESPESWSAWECHLIGDEVVYVLEGSGRFLQNTGEGVTTIPFKAGDAVINPRGVWHTADVDSPMRAMYLTPCPGTVHRNR